MQLVNSEEYSTVENQPPDMAGPAVPGFGGKPELEYGRRWKRAATGRRPVGGLWPKMENDGDGLAVPSGWR
jgi:hypothetical protein